MIGGDWSIARNGIVSVIIVLQDGTQGLFPGGALSINRNSLNLCWKDGWKRRVETSKCCKQSTQATADNMETSQATYCLSLIIPLWFIVKDPLRLTRHCSCFINYIQFFRFKFIIGDLGVYQPANANRGTEFWFCATEVYKVGGRNRESALLRH